MMRISRHSWRTQGITVEGLRRHFIRGTMSNIFTHELAKPAINSISVEILKAYYDQHEGEYHTNACVEWSEYVVSVNQNKTRADAKRSAEDLVARFNKKPDPNFDKRADDILWKVKTGSRVKSMNGPSVGRMAGDKPSPLIERLVQSLQEGEVGMVEGLNGFHVVRLMKRIDATIQPFTDQAVQQEIRKRLKAQIGDRVYQEVAKRLVTRALIEQALARGKNIVSSEVLAAADTDPIEKTQHTEDSGATRFAEDRKVPPVATIPNREPLRLPSLPNEKSELLPVAATTAPEAKVLTTVRGMPIYESEVREAVYQRNQELLRQC